MSNHCVTATAEHRSHCARRIENDRNLISNEVKLLKNSKIKSYEELPLFLNVPILADALGISESSAYELMKTKDFPTLRIGSRYFYISKKADEMIDSHIPIADARNRSDFIERAVEAYCGILDAEENKAILGQEVMRVCKAAVKDSENRLCNYLFKVAGEMGLLSYMVGADLINMTDEEIKKCRYKAFDEVRRQRGMLKLEDVVRKEREIAESEY